jgi:hypothetical protein
MPQMLKVANAERINLHFNIVWAPEYLSLQYLDKDRLEEVINHFERGLPATTSNPTATNNVLVYKEYIGTLKYWLQEKEDNPEADLEQFKQVVLDADLIQSILPTTEDAQLLVTTIICWYAEMNHSGQGVKLAQQLPQSEQLMDLLNAPNLPEAITQLRLQSTTYRHIQNFMEALRVLDKLMGTSNDGLLERRIAMVMPILERTPKQDQAAYDLGANGVFLQLRFLKQPSEELVFEKYASLFEQIL